MSTSASPSTAPSPEYAEHLSNLVAVPSLSNEHQYFLGPIGNLDPHEFITAETNKIPFRLASPSLGHWKNTFKSWPFIEKSAPEKSWPVWFKDINHERYQKSREVFATAISPCILLVSIHQGRNIQASYEFYHPKSSARQFGMGQLPISLYFADKIQCRGDISSALMMDRLLNNPGAPLGSIENIELARFRSRAFNRWWGEWKLHLFHQSASVYMTDLIPDVVPQTTESSPPRKSNSGKDIDYAPGLIPNGGGPSPPVIGYHAPKSSSLLQGLIREPTDASKKRKTKASAVDPSALASKKKAKTKKSKPSDDLPALDPSIEQALDKEEIEDDKKKAVKMKSAPMVPKLAPPRPPPPSPPVQPESSNRTPLAAGSHNIEEEEQLIAPAIPKTLEDISHRLEASSLDSLLVDCGSIRTRLHEVQALISDELADVLTPAVYLEQHQFKLEKAKLRLAERRERKDIEATIQANRQLVHEEKSKLDQLSEGPIKSNIDRLEARKIELIAQLEESDLPQAIEEQKARLKSAIKNVADMTKSLKVIPGTDAQDAQAIEEVEQIRQRAISAIQRYLSQ
uniref:Aminotransferase-like protein n=1 Tax=Oryza nivara TaxID=4536 RepID=A0A679BBU2_ORYNI|nr:aminotransferase-like protein [Oryza sativa f. spontanea]